MKARKYYNRDQRFTEDEKWTIAKKSDDKCCVSLQGLSLKNVTLKIFDENEKIYELWR